MMSTLMHSFLVKNCTFLLYYKQNIFTIELTPTLNDTTERCAEELSNTGRNEDTTKPYMGE